MQPPGAGERGRSLPRATLQSERHTVPAPPGASSAPLKSKERAPMFVTNHVLAGAVIGTVLRRRPVLAFAVGVGSHVAMDLTPHWGCEQGDSERFLVVARRDGLIGLGVIGAAIATGVPPRRALVAAMAGAALLDVNKPCEHFIGRSPFPEWVDRFHRAIQSERYEEFGTELVAGAALVAAATALLARQRLRSR
jgi:hypothetical protein